MFEIRRIEFGSETYREEILLRDAILRRPLGLRFSDEELAKESDQHHFGAFREGRLVGTLVLAPYSKDTLKMRQVAVLGEMQGHGIGKLLVMEAEAFAKREGYAAIELSAREEAVRFYLALGYATVGDSYVEVTIPHRKMTKRF